MSSGFSDLTAFLESFLPPIHLHHYRRDSYRHHGDSGCGDSVATIARVVIAKLAIGGDSDADELVVGPSHAQLKSSLAVFAQFCSYVENKLSIQ